MTHFTAQKRQNKFSKENRLVKGIENVLDFKIENNNPYKGNVKFQETRYGFRFLSSEVHLNFLSHKCATKCFSFPIWIV